LALTLAAAVSGSTPARKLGSNQHAAWRRAPDQKLDRIIFTPCPYAYHLPTLLLGPGFFWFGAAGFFPARLADESPLKSSI